MSSRNRNTSATPLATLFMGTLLASALSVLSIATLSGIGPTLANIVMVLLCTVVVAIVIYLVVVLGYIRSGTADVDLGGHQH